MSPDIQYWYVNMNTSKLCDSEEQLIRETAGEGTTVMAVPTAEFSIVFMGAGMFPFNEIELLNTSQRLINERMDDAGKGH